MSLSGVNPDIDDSPVPVRPDPDPDPGAGRRWPVPEIPRLSPPMAGMLIFAGIRVIGVAVAALMLRHGRYELRHWSLVRWMRAADGGHYLAIAAHGYTYPPGQLAHASVFAWFPGYPAVIDSVAWLPGVGLVAAGIVVTAVAGLAAAWGLTALGLKLTGDPRVSLLMVAIWAVAPSSTVLSMIYAEALFCALAIWALVALVSRRWLTAAGLTLAAGTVRSAVVALILAVCAAALIAVIRAVRARQPFARWWRPLAAMALAPLGLLGYLGYVALATHRLDGWFWIENHTCHMTLDWGVSTLRLVRRTLLGAPTAAEVLAVSVIIAAVLLMLWSLTERIPVYLHLYTIVVVVTALVTSANWVSSKPRFLLPAVLLALPVARLLAPLRTSVLVPLICVLAVATTWFGLYLLVVVGWAP
jgi:Mannosyltransferase (PIG-V)